MTWRRESFSVYESAQARNAQPVGQPTEPLTGDVTSAVEETKTSFSIVLVSALASTFSSSVYSIGGLGERTEIKLLLLNAQEFGRRLKRNPVNPLLRQLHGIQADATDLVTLLLQRDVEPILLLHGVAFALVVASRVSLLGLFLRGIMQRLAHDDSARCACGGDERIAIGDFVA